MTLPAPSPPPVPGGRSPVAAADLEVLADLGPLAVSADGSLVAAAASRPVLADNRYERRVVVAGGDLQEIAPLDPHAGLRLPAFAPAGRRLATATAGPGGHGVQVDDLATGGRHAALEGWPEPIEELVWSPDGRHLVFVAREPTDPSWWALPEDRRPPLRVDRLRYREDGEGWTYNRPHQLYLLDTAAGAAGSPPRKLSTGGFDDTEPAWHPDGRRLVFVSARQPGADRTIVKDLFVLDTTGDAAPRRLTPTDAACAQPAVSPDGATVAFVALDVARFPSVGRLATVPVAGGPVTVLSDALDRDCNSPASGTRRPVWLDADRLLVAVDDAGATHAWELAAAPGTTAPRRVLGGDRRCSSLAAAGGTLAWVETGTTTPPRVVARPAAGDAERTLHDPHAAYRAGRRLHEPAHHPVGVAPDVTVDAWLTLPDAGRWPAPHPLLVCLQGGGTQFGAHWSHELQLLAASGFATLYLNARGSAGYDDAWQRAVCGPRSHTPGRGWGHDDVRDVVAVLDAVLAAHPDQLDRDRVGVQGGSYGGLVTTWLLADSDRFAAGWAERGPYDLVSLAGTNDESPWFFEAYLGPTVVDDPAAYWEASPLRLARQITAPLCIVHSERDLRCPVQQAEQLFMALKLLDRPVELLRFPGESHGLSRTGSPVHRRQRLELLVDWFTRWLAPGGGGPPA
ncbi:MAG TPA: S9 family peptidase [Acidimicrobiales bacterium]|nr:S9 family peptidase [Acidimicrobiales bacterium]